MASGMYASKLTSHIWTRPRRPGGLGWCTNWSRCRPLSRLVVKASARLRALMTCAPLLLINVSAFTALDHVSVWRSRSDQSCHQLHKTPCIVWQNPLRFYLSGSRLPQGDGTLDCEPRVPTQSERSYWLRPQPRDCSPVVPAGL